MNQGKKQNTNNGTGVAGDRRKSMKEDCKTCTYSTKKPGGKVSCSEHPEKGKAFKPIDDCPDYVPAEGTDTMTAGESIKDPEYPADANSLIRSNTSMLTARTPELIAAEINDLKKQTRKMILYNSIEIGRRLVEAKSMLDHGAWGSWLENSVDYSQRTAENLMRIFEEYGSEQITFLTDNAKSQAFANLSYTQAVALLGIPEEEREAFISDNDIDNMSTRELQQAIKARNQALLEKEQAVKEKENALAELEKLKEEAQTADDKINTLIAEKDKLKDQLDSASKKADENLVHNQNELDKAKKDLEKKQIELEKLNTKIKELETKSLEVKPGATPEDIEKIKSETAATYEKDLAILRTEKEQAEKRAKELEIKVTQQSNAAALRYKVYFETLTKDFTEILKALSDIKDTDADTYERYKKATGELISKMAERL